MKIDITDEVRLKDDPSKEGIAVGVDVMQGVRMITVAWFGSKDQPTEHVEEELELVAHARGPVINTIIGNATNVTQAGYIEGHEKK